MNPILMGSMERRLLMVERGLDEIGRDLRQIARDQVEIGQGTWDEASTIRRRGSPAVIKPPTPNVTFSVHINGCISGNLGGVGATVQISLAGSLLYTGVTDASSNLNDSFYSPAPASTYSWTVIPATVRQSTATFSRPLVAGSNALFNQSLSANTGSYACMTSLNSLPPKVNLQCVDSSAGGGGTMILPFVSAAGKWFKVVGSHNYAMGQNGSFFLDGSTLNLSITSATWTDTGVLNVVYTLGANRAGHSSGDTFTVTEP